MLKIGLSTNMLILMKTQDLKISDYGAFFIVICTNLAAHSWIITTIKI